MKSKEIIEFGNWLKEFCETEYDRDKCEIKWKVGTETHRYKLMSTKQAYKWFKKFKVK